MRKTTIFIAATLLMAGCYKAELESPINGNPEGRNITIIAGQGESRAYVSEVGANSSTSTGSYSLVWDKGDAIGLYLDGPTTENNCRFSSANSINSLASHHSAKTFSAMRASGQKGRSPTISFTKAPSFTLIHSAVQKDFFTLRSSYQMFASGYFFGSSQKLYIHIAFAFTAYFVAKIRFLFLNQVFFLRKRCNFAVCLLI